MKLLKSKIAVFFIVFSAVMASADTAPITDIFKMKGEGKTGSITVESGVVKNIIPGSSGNVLVSDGTKFVSGAQRVTSVNTQTGAVVLNSDNINEGVTNLYYTDARARASLSATSPLGYTSSTGVFAIPLATSSANGYLSSSDWSLFNAKEPAITSGLSSQYWRGDKTFQTLDTSVVSESGNLYYTSGRFDSAFSGKTTTNLSEGSNLYYTQARFDTALAAKSTTDVAEGSNLYYTTGRFDTAFSGKTTTNLTEGSNLYYTSGRFDTAFAAKSTSNLSEGSNLYYTTARFDTALATKTTTNLTEGTNLYYTDARVQALAKNNTGSQEFWVTKDNGNDANDCSFLKPCKTIQAGINAANAVSAYYMQTIVHVAPTFGGTGSEYVENVTFSQQGVNLICDNPQVNSRACFISGTITVNLNGVAGGALYNAASNEVYMNSFVVSATSTNNALVFSGSTFQRFISINNYFDQNGSASSAVISNSGVGSQVSSYDTTYSNSNATNPTVSITSAARFWMYGTISIVANGNASGPSVTQSGVGSSAIYNLVQLTGQYNLSDNTSTASFNLSTITSGANPCLVTSSSPSTGYALFSYFGCNSSNTNSITGTGVVVNSPGNVRFGSSGDIVSTVTQASLGGGFPQGEILIGPGATSGTNVALSIKDAHLKATNGTNPTTTLSANAGTGGSPACTLTHASDTAGYISLKTGTASWATSTQCSINFNKAWTTIPVCIFSPSNDAAATAMASQRIVFPDASTTVQTISAGVAFASQVTATWHYHCLETN